MSIQNKIDSLQQKIDYLQTKQVDFEKYIIKLQTELDSLKVETGAIVEHVKSKEPIEEKILVSDIGKIIKPEKELVQEQIIPIVQKPSFVDKIKKEIGFDWDVKADWENFIGTNLINKIGILIVIFGVIVGAKYSIDNNLISPLTRIIIGYTISLSLLAVSVKLSEKYTNFSAVLLGGSLATLYFLSYMSYDFYGFISQPVAFVLMLLFTAFAVIASMSYNKQIISLIGLVGSYSIPFLLSNDSGNALFLFSYMAIVNIGILILSFKKNWKVLYYTAFSFTWLIFIAWYAAKFNSEYFTLSLVFLTVFYLIFYIVFLAYKLIRKEAFVKIDVVFILLNSFVFYSLGFLIIGSNKTGEDYLGLFTVLNAVVHFVVSKIIFKQKDGDKNLFYLAIVMVLIFITLAIPVQLSGSWIALFWTLEATLLFWFGRAKGIAIYEKLSYGLIVLSVFSLFTIWQDSYFYDNLLPFFNVNFLISLIASVAFGFISKLVFDKKYSNTGLQETNPNIIQKLLNIISEKINIIIPTIFVFIVFSTFANEISQFFDVRFNNSMIEDNSREWPDRIYNYDINGFKMLYLLFYSILFAVLISFINLKVIKNIKLAIVSNAANLILLFIALSAGLMESSDLRASYLLHSPEVDMYSTSLWNLNIRYFNYFFIAILVFTIYKYVKTMFNTKKIKQFFWLGFHIVIVWLLSSELLHWMDIYNNKNAYKIALTILWASYSLFAIALGIWKKHKFLRIGAFGLFAITLVKLFLYDLAHLSTIHKTIVLISVGVLLLIVSFLYNKYTNVINEENDLK